MKALWAVIETECKEDVEQRNRYPLIGAMVGMVERCLYTASWEFKKPEFIAVWLALKVAGQGRQWGEKDLLGRIQINLLLIGSGFSVAYGVIGGALIDWTSRPN